MSQKKNEAYKEAKKNKRANDKKAKRKKIVSWIIGIIIALAVIGGSVFLVYYTDVMLPKKQAAENAEAGSTIDASDLIQMTGEDSNVEVVPAETEAEDATTEVDAEADAVPEDAVPVAETVVDAEADAVE